MNKQNKIQLAKELNKLWDELEQTTGEQAAYSIACMQLNISEDYGYELLALIAKEGEK